MAGARGLTEDDAPGDLAGAATDELGGSTEIASDDPGAGALAGGLGRTAGGGADLGAGGASGPDLDDQEGAASIAADDAGAGRWASEAAERSDPDAEEAGLDRNDPADPDAGLGQNQQGYGSSPGPNAGSGRDGVAQVDPDENEGGGI